MNVRVDLQYAIQDGTEVVFRSPVDCSQVTGLVVYYPDGEDIVSQEFLFADAHGNNVGDVDHLFSENAVVKVILDVITGMAFVQNADTNAYLEDRLAEAVTHTPQSLTPKQQAQARENIDATQSPLVVRVDGVPFDGEDLSLVDNTVSDIYSVASSGRPVVLSFDYYGGYCNLRSIDSVDNSLYFDHPAGNVDGCIKLNGLDDKVELIESDAVRYSKQYWSESHKAQARENIGASSVGKTTSGGGEIFNDYKNNEAGYKAAAFGEWSKASGEASLAAGMRKEASGKDCNESGFNESMWRYNESIGTGSVAIGMGAVAYSRASKSLGYRTQTGYPANEEAAGNRSEAKKYGYKEEHEGQAAVAIGSDTVALANNSLAGGHKALVTAKNSLAFGSTATNAAGEEVQTTASGSSSVALGGGSIASGSNSFSCGLLTEASGNYSAALGNNTIASGPNSFAIGVSTSANGDRAVATGTKTNASGVGAVAIGNETKATGNASFASGWLTNANGHYSYALGRGTSANKDYSSAFGIFNTADAEAQTSIGKYNAKDENALFIVGNGTGGGSSRKNAFVVKNDGDTLISGNAYINGDKPVATQKYVDDAIANAGGSAEGTVLYTVQTLTDEQKAQARANIGAIGTDSFDVTFGGDVTVGSMVHADQVAANAVLTSTIVGPVTFINDVLCDYELNVTERLSAYQIYVHEDIYVQDDKKVATEEYVNTTLGGVETALDSILAIQNNLIGGDA